eukprot:1160302-Pelagomonas_calceolata.AAC.7
MLRSKQHDSEAAVVHSELLLSSELLCSRSRAWQCPGASDISQCGCLRGFFTKLGKVWYTRGSCAPIEHQSIMFSCTASLIIQCACLPGFFTKFEQQGYSAATLH